MDELSLLRDSLAALDDVFLVVVVGEFNSGKSTVINALLGAAAPLVARGAGSAQKRGAARRRHGSRAAAANERAAVAADGRERLSIQRASGRRRHAIPSRFAPRAAATPPPSRAP
jgi:septin family protein